MHEDHAREQFFFAPSTLEYLGDRVRQYRHPVLLCCPMLGHYLWERYKLAVPVLDVDDRFSLLPGYQHWSLHRPEPLPVKPDLIVCDPPFSKIDFGRVFNAIRVLAHGDFKTHLLLAYLGNEDAKVTGTFAPFHLQPSGYRPQYITVPTSVGIELFSNLSAAE